MQRGAGPGGDGAAIGPSAAGASPNQGSAIGPLLGGAVGVGAAAAAVGAGAVECKPGRDTSAVNGKLDVCSRPRP
jgi:hypothetical protein